MCWTSGLIGAPESMVRISSNNKWSMKTTRLPSPVAFDSFWWSPASSKVAAAGGCLSKGPTAKQVRRAREDVAPTNRRPPIDIGRGKVQQFRPAARFIISGGATPLASPPGSLAGAGLTGGYGSPARQGAPLPRPRFDERRAKSELTPGDSLATSNWIASATAAASVAGSATGSSCVRPTRQTSAALPNGHSNRPGQFGSGPLPAARN